VDIKTRKTKWRLKSLKQEGRRNQDKKWEGEENRCAIKSDCLIKEL